MSLFLGGLTVFQITDMSRFNDLTVAALWPDRLLSAKPEIFVNFPCTWQSFLDDHRCCFTGSQHNAMESIYELTLLGQFDYPVHLTQQPISCPGFIRRGSTGQPHHEGAGFMYSRPTAHRMALLDASNLVWWMCPRESCSVCAQGEKLSSFRHSYYCKCKHEATNFFIRGLGPGE